MAFTEVGTGNGNTSVSQTPKMWNKLKNPMHRAYENHPEPLILVASVVVTAVLAILALVVFAQPLHFRTNDDVNMMMVVSGLANSLVPDEHIMFSHILLGKALAGLYSVAGNVPWYGYYHLVFIILSLFAHVYAVLLCGFSLRRFLLFVPCTFVLMLPIIFSLQFTTTAFFAAQGGMFLLLTIVLRRGHVERFSGWTFLRCGIGVGLLFFGYLTRMPAFCLLLLLSFPVVAVSLFGVRKDPRTKPLVAAAAVVAIILVGLTCYDRWYYAKDSGWKYWRRLNLAKIEFIDYDRVKYTQPNKWIFDQVGWSESDFEMLRQWCYTDSRIYSPENLQAIASHFRPFDRMSAASLGRKAAGFLRENILSERTYSIIILSGLICFFGIHRRDRCLMLLAAICVTVLAGCFLKVFFRLPVRVWDPMLWFIAWVALLLNDKYRPGEKSRRRRRIMKAVACLLVGASVWASCNIAKSSALNTDWQKRNEELRTSLAKLNPTDKQLFVIWAIAFPYEYVLPFEDTGYLRNFRIISLGWPNQSPFQKKMLESFGISDLWRAIYERPNVFVAIHPKAMGCLRDYILEHYGVVVAFVPYFDEGAPRSHKQKTVVFYKVVVRSD